MKKTASKPYWQLGVAELAEATKEFDKEFVPTKPLTPSMTKREVRARRKMGRPRIGKGALRVLVTVERDLLQRADVFARRHKLTRSGLIAHCLKAVLAAG